MKKEHAALERRLRRHYAAQRAETAPEEILSVTTAMVGACRSRATPPARPIGSAAFVAAQTRMVPRSVWVAQAAFLALAMLLSARDAGAAFTYSAAGMLSSLTVVMAASAVHASRTNRVAEVECSCRFDFASVTVARLIALGCLQALCMVIAAAVLSGAREQGFLAPFLYLCLPYFCTCAGSLGLLRRPSGQMAVLWCGAWALCCCGVSFLLGAYAPFVYEAASLGAWALAAAAAALWLACEVRRTIEDARTGVSAVVAGAVSGI